MRSIVEKLIRDRILEDEHPQQLNPKLFDANGYLYQKVSMKILEIVNSFLDYIQVSINVLDIRLVGSNVAYNYTPQSDLDVHIVTDLSKISDPESIARLYFDSVKKNFKDNYDITIRGIDVELYVEDVNTTSISNGIYSVFSDNWIKHPTPAVEPSEDLINSVDTVASSIKYDIRTAETADDLQDILDYIYIMRKDALATLGEMGAGNLVFKVLRNDGTLDELKDKIYKLRSEELSLKEQKQSNWIVVSEKTPNDGWEEYQVKNKQEAIEKIKDLFSSLTIEQLSANDLLDTYQCSDKSVDIERIAKEVKMQMRMDKANAVVYKNRRK